VTNRQERSARELKNVRFVLDVQKERKSNRLGRDIRCSEPPVKAPLSVAQSEMGRFGQNEVAGSSAGKWFFCVPHGWQARETPRRRAPAASPQVAGGGAMGRLVGRFAGGCTGRGLRGYGVGCQGREGGTQGSIRGQHAVIAVVVLARRRFHHLFFGRASRVAAAGGAATSGGVAGLVDCCPASPSDSVCSGSVPGLAAGVSGGTASDCMPEPLVSAPAVVSGSTTLPSSHRPTTRRGD
jgi:hypothetical protein